MPSAIPLLYRARRAVIIGDPHQLAHIATLRAQEEILIADEHGVAGFLPHLAYTKTSLYLAAESRYLSGGEAPVLLEEHYRSDPRLIGFSNARYYEGRLIPRTQPLQLVDGQGNNVAVYFWHDVLGTVPPTDRSAWNPQEVDSIVELVAGWVGGGLFDGDQLTLGIVTPFRLQVRRLQDRLGRQEWWPLVKKNVTVGTAHTFQGGEADIIVFSPVVGPGIRARTRSWVANSENLLNVSVTRARRAFHIVGSRQECEESGGSLAALVQWRPALNPLGNQSLSHLSPAQQQMAHLLTEAGLWWQHEVPVLDGRYRLDFLVVGPAGQRYDIEVDGRQHLNPDQVRSDAVRDSAVENLGIQVLRFNARAVFDRLEQVKSILVRLA